MLLLVPLMCFQRGSFQGEAKLQISGFAHAQSYYFKGPFWQLPSALSTRKAPWPLGHLLGLVASVLLPLPLASFLSGPLQGEACYISVASRTSSRLPSPCLLFPLRLCTFCLSLIFFCAVFFVFGPPSPFCASSPFHFPPSLFSPLLVSRVFFFPCPFCSLAFSFVSFCVSPSFVGPFPPFFSQFSCVASFQHAQNI